MAFDLDSGCPAAPETVAAEAVAASPGTSLAWAIEVPGIKESQVKGCFILVLRENLSRDEK